MLSNITHGKRIEVVRYSRNFDYPGETGWGFTFDSDEHGNVDVAALPELARKSYEDVVAGRVVMTDRGVVTYRHSYWQPGHGTCACGQVVTLDGDQRGDGIDCVCGRLYNGSGQELRPRSQWEENYDDY